MPHNKFMLFLSVKQKTYCIVHLVQVHLKSLIFQNMVSCNSQTWSHAKNRYSFTSFYRLLLDT